MTLAPSVQQANRTQEWTVCVFSMESQVLHQKKQARRVMSQYDPHRICSAGKYDTGVDGVCVFFNKTATKIVYESICRPSR